MLVNGQEAGRHEGGYLPFCLDITALLTGGENRLTVAVTDDAEGGVYGMGKRRLPAGRHLVHRHQRHLADGVAGERAGALCKGYPADAGL